MRVAFVHNYELAPPLVFPDHESALGLVSLFEATKLIDQLSVERKSVFCATYEPMARDNARLGEKVRQINPPSPILVALLGAAIADDLTIFVRDPASALAFPSTPYLWRGDSIHIADPVMLAVTGRFVVLFDVLPGSALEARLAGAYLYVRRKALLAMLKVGRVSEAALGRDVESAIAEFQRDWPGKKMRRAELFALIRKKHVGVSTRMIDRARKQHWPDEWCGGGRPRGN